MTSIIGAYQEQVDELQRAIIRRDERIAELEKQLADINLYGTPVYPSGAVDQIIPSYGK